MYLTIKGLVLRTTAYNDYDSLLTLLTADHGKMTVKARGLRRKNSPLAAPCQLLAYSEFTLFEYRDMYTINEARSVELFSPLRKDLEKLSLSSYFSQVAETVSQEDLPNPELVSLVLNCLFALSNMEISQTQVKTVFELRCACICGYTPDLTGCAECGCPDPDRFDVTQGQLRCSRCGSSGGLGIRLPVTVGMLNAMRYICFCDPKKLFQFELGQEAMGELSHLTETYLTVQLERGFSTLDFYKSLIWS